MDEFVLIWFESEQYWTVLLANGKRFGSYGSVGHARNAAMEYLDSGESDWDMTEETGNFYRFELSVRE